MNNKPRSRLAWKRGIRNLLLILLFFLVVQWWQSRGLALGEAPHLSGYGPQGELLALNDYRGQTVLVHFWADWCPICRLEEGSIQNLSADHPVLSVATTSGGPGEVQAYLKARNLDFPTIVDENGEMAGAWRVRGVPVSYIVNRKGEIVWAGAGFATEWGLRARLALADWGISLPL